MNNRASVFAAVFDFSTGGRGLEIGPLAKPVVAPGTADISYVDLAPRERLVAYYADDPHVDVTQIPEIDFWLTTPEGGSRTLREAVGDGGPFDYVVASHVIEHVPDVVGWLRDVAAVTADGGALVLAVPDRRFSFDALRPATTVGQALEAFEAGHRTPSLRAVYDQNRRHVEVDTVAAWRGEPPGSPALPFEYAVEKLEQVRTGTYVDTHVWVVTPGELLDLLDDLGRLGLLDFTVERLVPTPRNRLEFYVVLRRQERDLPAPEAAHARAESVAAARALLPDESRSVAHQRLAREHERTEAALERERERVARLRRRVERQQGRIARLEAEVVRLRGRAAATADPATSPAAGRAAGLRRLLRRFGRRVTRRLRPAGRARA